MLVRQECALLVVYKGNMPIGAVKTVISCGLQRWNGNRTSRIEGLPVVYREDMSIGATRKDALPVGSIKEL